MNDPRRYAAGILNVALGGNMSSRLFQEIREKRGLSYYVGSSHYSSPDDGLLLIRAGLEKQRFDWGKQAIYELLEDVKNKGISEEEYQKSLGYITGKTKMGIETSDQLADFVGEQYLLKGKIETLQEILENYKKVKQQDIQKVAEQMLEKNNLYAYWIS